jgi:protease IV
MRRNCFFLMSLILLLTTACAAPKIRLFTDASDPLREFTLQGRDDDKILLIPIKGMISDTPKKNFMRSGPSMV